MLPKDWKTTSSMSPWLLEERDGCAELPMGFIALPRLELDIIGGHICTLMCLHSPPAWGWLWEMLVGKTPDNMGGTYKFPPRTTSVKRWREEAKGCVEDWHLTELLRREQLPTSHLTVSGFVSWLWFQRKPLWWFFPEGSKIIQISDIHLEIGIESLSPICLISGSTQLQLLCTLCLHVSLWHCIWFLGCWVTFILLLMLLCPLSSW